MLPSHGKHLHLILSCIHCLYIQQRDQHWTYHIKPSLRLREWFCSKENIQKHNAEVQSVTAPWESLPSPNVFICFLTNSLLMQDTHTQIHTHTHTIQKRNKICSCWRKFSNWLHLTLGSPGLRKKWHLQSFMEGQQSSKDCPSGSSQPIFLGWQYSQLASLTRSDRMGRDNWEDTIP